MADPNDPQTNTSSTNTGEQGGGGSSKTGIYGETEAPEDQTSSDDPEYNGGKQKTGLYREQGA